MRFPLLSLGVLALVACSDQWPPSVNGTWTGTVETRTYNFTLSQHDTLLTGAGEYRDPDIRLSTTFTVSGTYLSPDVSILFTFTGGGTTQYAAKYVGGQTMWGVELRGTVTDSLTLHRQ